MAASPSPKDEPWPSTIPDTSKIQVLIRSQNMGDLVLKVKPTTNFSKVRDAWCKANGVDQQSVRFINDDTGDRIVVNKTIKELGIEPEFGDAEDEDGRKEVTVYVAAYLEQTGGRL